MDYGPIFTVKNIIYLTQPLNTKLNPLNIT